MKDLRIIRDLNILNVEENGRALEGTCFVFVVLCEGFEYIIAYLSNIWREIRIPRRRLSVRKLQ